jgi:hypothetical protein
VKGYAKRVVREGQGELSAVDRHQVEQRMEDERQEHQQPPASEQSRITMETAHDPRDEWRCQREIQQRMALGSVKRHVPYRVAVRNERVEIGQSGAHRAPHGRFPSRRARAHDGHADGGAHGDVC